jgi:hypothetical protein
MCVCVCVCVWERERGGVEESVWNRNTLRYTQSSKFKVSCQNISRLLWNPRIHYLLHNSSIFCNIPSEINPVHNHTSCLVPILIFYCRLPLGIFGLPTLRVFKVKGFIMLFILLQSCYMPHCLYSHMVNKVFPEFLNFHLFIFFCPIILHKYILLDLQSLKSEREGENFSRLCTLPMWTVFSFLMINTGQLKNTVFL